MAETLNLHSTRSLFLMLVMKDEKAKPKGNLGRLVIAVHAVFLESGFVLANEPLLPDGWESSSTAVSVRYTVPDLPSPSSSSPVPRSNGSAVVLSFSATGYDVSINGSLDLPGSRIYRISFDISKLAGPLISSMHGMSEKDKREVFKLWKIVSDKLSRPLLIDICFHNGLALPQSLMSLPTELKSRILDFLPGVDLARIECACFEWRQLASSDELWKQRFEKEFGNLGRDPGTWKQKYASMWIAKRNLERLRCQQSTRPPPREPYIRTVINSPLASLSHSITVVVGPNRVVRVESSHNLWRTQDYNPFRPLGTPPGVWYNPSRPLRAPQPGVPFHWW